MARRTYTDDDKARFRVALQAEDGNIARAAKTAGVAENTARDWVRKWAHDASTQGATTDLVVPDSVQSLIPATLASFEKELGQIAALGLVKMKELLPQIDDPKHIGLVITAMNSAIAQLKRLHDMAGPLAPPAEKEPAKEVDASALAQAVIDIAAGALEKTRERDLEIIEAEYEVQADKDALDDEGEPTRLALVAGDDWPPTDY